MFAITFAISFFISALILFLVDIASYVIHVLAAGAVLFFIWMNN